MNLVYTCMYWYEFHRMLAKKAPSSKGKSPYKWVRTGSGQGQDRATTGSGQGQDRVRTGSGHGQDKYS